MFSTRDSPWRCSAPSMILVILERFLSLRNRYSLESGTFVLVCTLLVSMWSLSLDSQSIEHWISPSKCVGYLLGASVILIFMWVLGFSSPLIGSNLRLSPHMSPDF